MANNRAKTKICHFYLKHQCKHGVKGEKCPFSHPIPCKHHCGSLSQCKNREKCMFWHPRLCKYKMLCRNPKCHRYHQDSSAQSEAGKRQKNGTPPGKQDRYHRKRNHLGPSPRHQSGFKGVNNNGQVLQLITQLLTMLTPT